MQIDSRANHVSGPSSRSVAAIATYRSAMNAAAKLPSNANAAGPLAVADKVSISSTAQALMDEAARRPDASDPLRAFRDANGLLTMDGVAQIQNMPPRVRDAAKGMREVASLGKEIGAMEADPNADAARLDTLRGEYAAARTKLSADLERAGLTDKMAKAGIGIDQLISSDTGVLVRLSSMAVNALNAAAAADKTAGTEKTAAATTAVPVTADATDAAAAQSGAAAGTAQIPARRADTVEEKPSLLSWFMDTLRRKLAPGGAEPAAA
ncbi:hypothetical protein M2352_004539 [Azospirillum fermentarium]|uniref:hypothetical protein n=1 Tax=Azospirillum fermentarium TaxID=1233114 RepID=UPI002227E29A|nr:hypothetical protein [Azospirillum fermentarium]MCW2248879.1 hypothetical protein [Azospirillum fermentarium]